MLENKYIFEGGFGLERETLRVTADGRLAQTLHPFKNNSYLERDFCENQLEIITPVCESVDEALDELGRLSEYAQRLLKENREYLWLNSNPPHFETEEEIPVAQYHGEKEYKRAYRINLQRRYGKKLMLYSGIHFNLSLSDDFLRSVYNGTEDFTEFKNDLYLRLLKYANLYSWLLVLLTAASPVYDLSFDGNNLRGTGFDGYSSRRNGDKGYWNLFVPKLDYSSLSRYVESVENYINKGALFSAGELYLPVRLKPQGENSLKNLVNNGVDHIEFRMFDINPLAPNGIFVEDLKFSHYFLIYLLSLPDFEFTADLQARAIENHKAAAGFYLDQIAINGYPAVDAAFGILDDMRIYFSDFSEITEIIDYQCSKLVGKNRYSDMIYRAYLKDFHNDFLKQIKERSDVTVCANCLERV